MNSGHARNLNQCRRTNPLSAYPTTNLERGKPFKVALFEAFAGHYARAYGAPIS